LRITAAGKTSRYAAHQCTFSKRAEKSKYEPGVAKDGRQDIYLPTGSIQDSDKLLQ